MDILPLFRSNGASVPATKKDENLESHSSGCAEACAVCFESVEPNVLISTGRCKHEVCVDCMSQYCEVTVMDQRSSEIPCPFHASGCGDMVEPSSVAKAVLLSPGERGRKVLQRYEQLRKLKADPSLSECTRCSHLVSPENSVDSNPSRQCPSCNHTFCSIHGDDHLLVSCTEFMKQQKRSADTLRTFSKPCSHCGACLFKYAGCDHVVCPSCKEDMCYKCGTHEFLSGKGTRSCSNCQQGFVDHRHMWRYRMLILLSFPIMLPFMIILSSVLLLAALLSCCCAGGFCCGKLTTSDGQQNIPRGLLFAFFVVFWPFIGFLYDCGFHTEAIDNFRDWIVSGKTEGHPDIPVMEVSPTMSSFSDSVESHV